MEQTDTVADTVILGGMEVYFKSAVALDRQPRRLGDAYPAEIELVFADEDERDVTVLGDIYAGLVPDACQPCIFKFYPAREAFSRLDTGLRVKVGSSLEGNISVTVRPDDDALDIRLHYPFEHYPLGAVCNVHLLTDAVLALVTESLYHLPYILGYGSNDLGRRLCGEIALHEVGTEQYHGAELLRRLDALRESEYIVIMAELYYLAHEMALIWAFLNAAEERAVYLDVIRHIAQEVARVGIARAVIVDSHSHAHFPIALFKGIDTLVVYLSLLRHLNHCSIRVLEEHLGHASEILYVESCLGDTVYEHEPSPEIVLARINDTENIEESAAFDIL